MYCTQCEGTGFLNVQQLPEGKLEEGIDAVLQWIETHTDHDVTVCDCCGDRSGWYGEPGQHYVTHDDQPGSNGPYAYNGGLCECN